MSIALHELHRRRLETTRQLIEESLTRIERLLREGDSEGSVEAAGSLASPKQRDRLLERIRELRAAVVKFAERFGLLRHPLDPRQVLNAELSSAWVMLENCRPKRMKGYGVPFEEETRTALEEDLEGLLAQVKELRAIIR